MPYPGNCSRCLSLYQSTSYAANIKKLPTVEAGEAPTCIADFPAESPTEKCSVKTTAFGVVTKSNHVHSGCGTKRERGLEWIL
jgi:hypothetical protein